MHFRIRPIAALFFAIAMVAIGFAADTAKRTPPPTKRDNVTETVQGISISDPYRWLEDQNSPDTRAWIDAQNQYTRSFLDGLPTRAEISARLEQLVKVDTMSAPTERGGRYFYTERKADQDLSVLHMRQGLDGKDEVLLDPHPLSADHTTSVQTMGISNDGKILLYGIRLGGADETDVHVMNVDTRTDTADKLERARYSGTALTPGNKGFYYGILTEAGPRVRYHAMGSDPSSDQQVFGDGYGREAIISPNVSEDGHYLTIHVAHGSSSDFTEIYIQDLVAKTPLKPLVNDVHARFEGNPTGDMLYMETNWNAPNGRVLAVDLKHPERDNWKEIIAESDSPIEGVSTVGGKLFVRYLQNATSQVAIFGTDGKKQGEITLPSIGSVSGVSGRWSSKQAFYSFTSFVVPNVINRYEIATGKQQEWFRTKVPIDANKFTVEQVWYASKDGTKVPMFLVYAKGLKKDGARPTLLTGYGGFNLNRTPGFTAEAVIFAEHGGIYALPNLRGGGEFGEKWHRAGMLANKQNVFDDFETAAEWLEKNGYTNPSKLAISGGSNGGLLVGAALTQRPELFRAVVCSYPLLDMVRYQKFFVARYWVSEYGSSEDPQQFQYIYKYSPYQNVKAGAKYPAVMFVSGDSDTRVAPLHARKMAALLQASQGGDNPILLHYDTKGGHSGGRSISRVIGDQTDEYSFLFWQLGVQPSGMKAAGK